MKIKSSLKYRPRNSVSQVSGKSNNLNEEIGKIVQYKEINFTECKGEGP